jgi:hypothetical protein
LEEVAELVSHKVLVEVDDNSALIVGNPQGILIQQHGPYPINLLNIITVTLIAYQIIINVKIRLLI